MSQGSGQHEGELSRIDPIDDDLVELYAEVDVEGLTPRDRYRVEQMAELVERNFQTFVSKNRDYGDAFRHSGALESRLGGGPFEDSCVASLYHLWVRASDKHHRLHNVLFSGNESRMDESSLDTALDAANYYMMIALLLAEMNE